MRNRRRDHIVHTLFSLGIIVKGIDGVLEIVGGIFLFVITPAQLARIASVLTMHELSEDPQDLIARYVLGNLQHLSAGAELFGAVYLLWHGVIKVGLVSALLLRRLWAYPVAIGAFLVFLCYQLYRYSHTYAPEMLVLSVLDILVIVLTWIEYRHLRTPLAPA